MTVYRNRNLSVLMTVIAVLFSAASVAATLSRDAAGLSAGARWAPVAVVVALSLFCLLRLARAGVYADEKGIRIVNPLATVRIPWERLQRFSLRQHKGYPALGFAELKDGTRVQIWGFQARSHTVAAKRVPEELVEQLNERLATERAKLSP